MSQPASKPHFDLSGGNLALDFVNTVSDRPTAEPSERLVSYNHLVLFGLESNLYPHGMVDNLYSKAGRAPGWRPTRCKKRFSFAKTCSRSSPRWWSIAPFRATRLRS